MYSVKQSKVYLCETNKVKQFAFSYNQKTIWFLSLCLMLIAAIQTAVVAAPPTYQAAGTVASGTGAITPTWPTHQAGDVALLIIETANQAVSLSVPAGFAEVTNSPQGTGTAGGTAATRLTVYWKRATTSAEPNPTIADSGDHQIGRIITFRGVIGSGDPWDVMSGSITSSSSTSVSISGATTTMTDTLVAVIVSNGTDTTTAQTSSWTNSNLTSLTEHMDDNTSSGNGGGFGVATGVKTSVGAYGTTTATLVASSVQAGLSIAFKPASFAPGVATSPSPVNSATTFLLTTDLSWTAGSSTTSHDIYFGTTSPGDYQGNQTGTTFNTGAMTVGTTYYWRIDEVNAYGTTAGTVWSFTTESQYSYVDINASDPNPDGSTWAKAYTSIQTAINAASAGKVVIVAPGTYPEYINLNGKAITVTSTDPNDPNVVAATIINPADTTKDVITCNSGETSATIIEGITLTGGQSGIKVSNTATPFITKCVISGNRYYGMYVAISGNSMTVSKCIIKNQNQSGAYGFYNSYGSVTLENSLIVKNYRGVYVSGGTGTFKVINCTVADNTYSGVTGSLGTEDVVNNSILWKNGDDFSGMNPPCVPTYCCIEDGDAGTGNISFNPQFVNATNNDYHLAFNSPCIDAGDPCSSYSNEPMGGGGRIDMGVYGNTDQATFIIDNDIDGMPDSWEQQYWPSDDPNQHDPNDDPDGDGLRNIDELQISWDPTCNDSSSILGFVTNLRTCYKYPSVNSAVQQAEHGDVLVMDPNHFVETINFGGKRIHLRSTDPNDPNVIAATIIDANDITKDVLTCNSGETSATIIEGVTLTGGRYGVYAANGSSAPLIKKCVIQGNSSYGMYITVSSGSMTISECIVNQNGNNGFYGYGNVTLKNCLFVNNSSFGVGVSDGTGTFKIENCTVANNHNYGVYGRFDEIKNSILWNNGNDIHNTWSSYTISYCCIEDGDAGTGNISSNPQFVNAPTGNYHLELNSPCVDAGDPCSAYSNEPQGGGGRIDMGAYGNTDQATFVFDGDSDGLPDSWERQYWPYDNPNQHDPNDDPDGDRLRNIDEFQIEWNPTIDDSNSIPGLVVNQRTGIRSPSINLAINHAESGDALVVDPNRFIETINLEGRQIHLQSIDPNDPNVVAATIIDANDITKDVLTCNSGETSATIIEGVTLTGGRYGIYAANGSSAPLIKKCVIQGNSSYGMYITVSSGSMAIIGCTITQNGSRGFYGYGNITLKNCIFADNNGCGIYVSDGWGTFLIESCTVANNNSGVVGGIDTIANSIIWGNGDDVASSCITSYCCIEDGDAGTGNISSNPQFIDAANGDYHLKSTEGRWTSSGWAADGINSPCIDAGQPWADYSQESAYANGGRLNVGAFGNTAEASRSVDSDNDGLSDAWELNNFGNLNQNSIGENGNFDNDDFDNQIEYYFNYDPMITTNKDIEISNLHQSVVSFDPTLNQTVIFDFWLNKPTQVRLKDADSNDIFFDIQIPLSPGYCQIAWDGTAVSDGLILAKKDYNWRLETLDAVAGLGSKDKTGDPLVPINLTYGHQITSISCNPRRMIPVFNEVANIDYGIDFGQTLSQWPVTITVLDPDGDLFATVISDYNQTEGDYSVIWNGKNGPDGSSTSRYPSKNGEYTVKIRFSGMREASTKSIYIYK